MLNQLGWIVLASGGGGGGLLDPATGLVFWTALTFSIVAIVLGKFAWGPLIEGLDQREAKIRESLAAAETARDEAKRIASEQDAVLQEYKVEAEKILEEARSDAQALRERSKREADQETAEIKVRATQEIGLAKEKAIDEIREMTVGLAMDLAGRVLKAEIDGDKHKGLVNEFLAASKG